MRTQTSLCSQRGRPPWRDHLAIKLLQGHSFLLQYALVWRLRGSQFWELGETFSSIQIHGSKMQGMKALSLGD